MIFHTFGNKEGKTVLLIHGVLTPWQIWSDYIDSFKGEFFVVVPELDAHTQGGPSSFVSAEDEASRISSYIREELGGKVCLLAGLSMGGYIAATIAKDKDISIDNLVLDGAPLLKVNGLLKRVFKKNYISIIRRSKERDPKVIESAKKDFLPERYIDDYLKIADNIDEGS
nr:alpha/beta hydrolase [Saccharofermentans sp.]